MEEKKLNQQINKIESQKSQDNKIEKIPLKDLVIINKIASFFGKYSKEAKKILIDRYYLKQKKGVIRGYDKIDINLEMLFEEQKNLYLKRQQTNTEPTLGTLKVALGMYKKQSIEEKYKEGKIGFSKKKPNLDFLDKDKNF